MPVYLRHSYRVYVAGPMRHRKDFNFPAFKEAADRLRSLGHEVFSPAERDTNIHGDEMFHGDGDLATIESQGFNLRKALAADLNWITLHADAVAVLPGWEDSLGAQAEVATARAIEIPVAPVGAFWPSGPDPRALL